MQRMVCVIRRWLCGVFLCLSVLVWADEQATLQFELEAVIQLIEAHYAPLGMKASSVGLRWPEVKDRYRARVKMLERTEQFYGLVREMLTEFDDGHLRILASQSRTWSLPVQFVFLEGETLLNRIDREDELAAGCAARPGDRLLSIDTQTPDQIRSLLSKTIAIGNPLSNAQKRTARMTQISSDNLGVLGGYPKGKNSDLFFESYSTGKTIQCRLAWSRTGANSAGRKVHKIKKTVRGADDEILTESVASTFFKLPEDFKYFEPSTYQTLLVQQGLWGGKFTYAGRRIGLLRISSYQLDSERSPYQALLSLRYLIARFNAETDLLLIDQTGNSGGDMNFGDFVIRSLMGFSETGKIPKLIFRPTVSRSEWITTRLGDFLALTNNSDNTEQPRLQQLIVELKKTRQNIQNSFHDHGNFTDPVRHSALSEVIEILGDQDANSHSVEKRWASWRLGVDVFRPQVYTKRVFILVDELNASAAEYVSAALQDAGRATLVGTRTAGMGGVVEPFSLNVLNPFQLLLTTGLVVRADGSWIENYGVHPDIEFPVLASDIQEGYSHYLDRLLARLSRYF